MKYNDKSMTIKKNNLGFTLVELIVVLVILAILAAILVPALLGYIEDAKDKQDLLNAKNCLTAIQSELTKLYAKTSNDLKTDKFKDNTHYNYLLGEKTYVDNNHQDQNRDVYAVGTDFAKKVSSKWDVQPYLVLFAAGDYSSNTGVTKHDAYTVCYLFYQETADSKPLYFYNGEWSRNHPRFYKDKNGNKKKTDSIVKQVTIDGKKLNIMQVGSLKGKAIEYYLIINMDNKKYGEVWQHMENKAYQYSTL